MAKGRFNDLLIIIRVICDLLVKRPDLLHLIPVSNTDMESLLKQAGYIEPKTYYACISDGHSSISDDLTANCTYFACKKPYGMRKIKKRNRSEGTLSDPFGDRGDVSDSDPETNATPEDDQQPRSQRSVMKYSPNSHVIPMVYIRIKDRLRRLFTNPYKCQQMLGHWHERHHWLQQDHRQPADIMNEAWDGTEFRKFSFFFDPTQQYLLPQPCPNLKERRCIIPFSAQQIHNQYQRDIEHHPDVEINRVNLQCTQCLQIVDVPYQLVTGNPRNILLQYHIDGYEPFSNSSKHGTDAMTLTILNMRKRDRCKVSNVFLLGMIRKNKEDRETFENNPNHVDPFYTPMMEDLVDGFVNGIECDYPLAHPSLEEFDIHPGTTTIRYAMPSFVADYVAMCSTLKTKSKGEVGCRDCRAPSKWMSRYLMLLV